MTTAETCTIPALFFARAREHATKPYVWKKQNGAWQPTSWAEAARIVRRLAVALRSFGIRHGDRVALIAENQPAWVLSDLAIMATGAITVPAYTTYSTEDYRHVLADSGAKIVILGSNVLAQKVMPAAGQIEAIISFELIGAETPADIYLWNGLIGNSHETAEREIEEIAAALSPDDIACLIYTSGTSGVPKGVMLSHDNILSNARGAHKLLSDYYTLKDETFLSFLPLTHSYEHTAGFVLPLFLGAETYFTTPDALLADLAVVRPTIMTAVPRLFETMQKRIAQGMGRTGGWKLSLFHQAVALGKKRYETPGALSVSDRLFDLLLGLLVRSKIRQRFGGRLKLFVSGGAPLNPEIALFFIALGVKLIQGYGQTESSPVVGVNLPGRIKVRTSGPPLDRVEIRIADDGEVLVRGPNVMKGYWGDPEATARVIRDGWLHTGDVGNLDEDNYLTITDRKRDFIKNSGGEMISPQRIESLLTLQPGIAQALIHGEQRPYLVALIVPDIDHLPKPATAGIKPSNNPAIISAVANAVAAVNNTLSPGERIRRHALIDESFNVDNGQMTPTLKIRRHTIRQAYGGLIDDLYDNKQA